MTIVPSTPPSRNRPSRSPLSLVAGAAVALLVIGGSTLTGGVASAAPFHGASPEWPANPDWQKYVQTPKTPDVRPVSIVSVSGDVTNEGALVDSSEDGVTTLTATTKHLNASEVIVDFPAISTRYLRLNVTKLGLPASNDTNGSYVQLAELQAFGADNSVNLAAGKTVTTSESLENFGWGARFLTDGVKDTENGDARGWTTNLHGSTDVSSSPIWTTIDLGSVQSVSSVVLWPRTDTLSTDGRTANFPVDYTVQTSATDAQTPSFAVQKTVAAQPTPTAPVIEGPASIVLDYGHNVGGYPWFDVSAASGSPTLQAGYSETKTQISPTGDGVSPWASGDPNRFNTYTVTGPGRITNKQIQGGQRYEMISLTTPGTISLSAAGIIYTPYIPEDDPDAGNFVSSSDDLNKFWHDGSYTNQINQVPVNSVGARWSTETGALDVPGVTSGSGVGPLKTGADWTDYTVTFKTKIIKNQAGWVVRSTDSSNGYLFILSSSDSTDGAGKSVLQQLSLTKSEFKSIKTIALAAPIAPIASGAWYTIKQVVSGTTVTTFINGTQVASIDSATFASGIGAHAAGTVGFREFTPEEAQFSDLSVTAPDDSVLYEDELSDESVLADFSIPGANTVPLILDGAKRDRAVWSGDLAVEGPTLYYTTNSSEYIKGSLELLGSWTGKNGYVPGSMPPTTPIALTPPDNTQGGYSANYSMYFVRALADYYLYTGDDDFVKKEWSIVEKQLAYNQTLVGANGLVVTDNNNGADWDYYDGNKTGEVTTYNALYYQVLLDGAKLAAAIDKHALADQYTAKAAAVKTAINARLFNNETGMYNLSNNVTNVVAQDANVFAVLFGIAPKNKVAGILSGIKTSLWTDYGTMPFSGNSYQKTISPFISGFELNARFDSGDAGNALELLSNEWGPMIAPGDLYTGTFWENLNANGVQAAGNTNMAHGWSTMPTAALSKYVLGVQPVTAGYDTWLVQPHPDDLDWTKGQAPTPHGPIVVNWSHDKEVGFAMHVEAPTETSGTIAVPTFGKSIDITVNGTKVWSHGLAIPGEGVTEATLDGDYVTLTVGSGTFEISTGDAVPSEQTITFDALTDKSAADPDFTVSATASSGLAVSFTAEGPCAVTTGSASSGSVHLTGSGTCTITAAQAGDAQFAPATSVSRGFEVTPVTTPPVTIKPAKVTITGLAKVGAKLTAHAGSWGTPVTLEYQWLNNGKAIAKATKSSYKLVTSDIADRVSVRITASAEGASSVTVTSSGVKVYRALTSTPTPKIKGVKKVGHKLTVSAGTWKPSKVSLSYRWYRNGVAISHASGKSYKLTKSDKGKTVSVTVTGSKSGYLPESKSRSAGKIK